MKAHYLARFESYSRAYELAEDIKDSLESLEQLNAAGLKTESELLATILAANISRINCLIANLKQI